MEDLIRKRTGSKVSRDRDKNKQKEIDLKVKNLVESKGYRLISKDFRSTVVILCEKDHKITTKTDYFKLKDFECEKCAKKLKLLKSLKKY